MQLDPIRTREVNLLNEDGIIDVINTIKKESDYENRVAAITKFNKNNKWKKRGLGFNPMKWPVTNMTTLGLTLSVFNGDGSIVITHGGIEIGQGVNTKAIQVCAYTLKIPMSKIKVKATNVISNPNSFTTGGSVTSDAVCAGVIKCCQILLERLAPIRTTLKNATWEQLIETAHTRGVNLFVTYKVTMNDLKNYFVYGATVTEVEIDVLTGELQVVRVDLLEDVGQSLSPEIDVGQVSFFNSIYLNCTWHLTVLPSDAKYDRIHVIGLTNEYEMHRQ